MSNDPGSIINGASRKQAALRWGGLALSAAGLVYFVHSLISHVESLSELLRQPLLVAAGLVGSLLWVLLFCLIGISWCFFLRALGQRAPFGDSVKILGLSQILKYLPGNVGHHLGRVALAKSRAWRTAPVLAAMTAESLFMLSAAVAVGLLAIAMSESGFGGSLADDASRLVTAVLPWGILAIGAVIVVMAVVWKRGSFRRWLTLSGGVGYRGRDWAAGVTLVAGAALILPSIAVLANAAINGGDGDILYLIGVTSLAWVIGFVVPGAPAGLGVREAVMLSALSPGWGQGDAIAIALVVRGVTTLGDGLVFGVGLLLPWNRSNADT